MSMTEYFRIPRRLLLGMILLGGCGSVPLLEGCGDNPPPERTGKAGSFFDVEGYFRSEAARLKAAGAGLEKTAEAAGETETLTVQEPDWEEELALFIGSDINKPSWRDSYTADSGGTYLLYEATDPGLRIRSIRIDRDGRPAVTGILIRRGVRNYLYSSSETLRYYPDSLYEISRHQEVKLLGTSDFRVSGRVTLPQE